MAVVLKNLLWNKDQRYTQLELDSPHRNRTTSSSRRYGMCNRALPVIIP